MLCKKCGHEIEEGKPCPNCGESASVDEQAAGAEQKIEPEPEPEEEQVETVIESEPSQVEETKPTSVEPPKAESSEFVDNAVEIGSNVGRFLITHLKKPSDALQATSKSLIPAIITIVLFSFIFTINQYLELSSVFGGFFTGTRFINAFLVPLFKFHILFGLVPLIIFLAMRAVGQQATIPELYAKYGAYIVPLVGLVIVSLLFSAITLNVVALFLMFVNLITATIVIPILILKEETIENFDQLYVVLGLVVIALIALLFFVNHFMTLFALQYI